MKKKFFFIYVLIQLMLLNIYAKDKGKDFIIKMTNDTIFGRIEPKSDIDFRASISLYDNENKLTTYSPDEILAFYLESDNRFFESKSISLNGTNSTFFLRCLVKGDVSLYLLREMNEQDNRFYYQNRERSVELINTKTQKTINGKTYNTYKYEYVYKIKNELTTLCQELLPLVDKLNFNERELALFIEKVNRCISYENPGNVYLIKNRVLHNTGVNANIGFNKVWPATGTSYGIGFYQEAEFTEISRSIFLSYGVDLEYGALKDSSDYFKPNYSKVSLPVCINFKIGKQDIQPYFSAGIVFINYFQKSKTPSTNLPSTDIVSVIPITIGGGVKSKKLNLVLTTNIYDTRFKLVYFFN